MLKEIEKLCEQFENNTELLAKELKRIQSTKCRLKKQKGRIAYEDEMTTVVKYEQALKEAKALLEPKEKPVTMYEIEDVEKLTYDELVKAIRSIQSKKTLSRWLTTKEGDNDEFRNAVKIEEMLLEQKSKIKPIEETVIRKTELTTIIDTIESNNELSQERILELLKKLM